MVAPQLNINASSNAGLLDKQEVAIFEMLSGSLGIEAVPNEEKPLDLKGPVD